MGLGMTSAKSKHVLEGDQLKCPHCGLTYREFINSGRLAAGIVIKHLILIWINVIGRLHGGNVIHIGKIPKRAGGTITYKKAN